jgi:hypothetical protein
MPKEKNGLQYPVTEGWVSWSSEGKHQRERRDIIQTEPSFKQKMILGYHLK